MPSKEEIISRAYDLSVKLGRGVLNTLFPNDFEYYMVALELVDSKGYTIDYLCFPVNPSSISQSEPQLTNIKQALGGVTVIKTQTFSPKDLKITGDFGRNFKILITPFSKSSFRAFGGGMSVKDGVWRKTDNPSTNPAGAILKKLFFNSQIKTGYGCTKLLQAICDKSSGVDLDGNPTKLYIYNMTLGESWLVEVIDLTLDQNKGQSNMLWQYSLTLKIVAPVTKTKKGSLIAMASRLTFGLLQSAATSLAQEGYKELKKTMDRKTNDVVRVNSHKS